MKLRFELSDARMMGREMRERRRREKEERDEASEENEVIIIGRGDRDGRHYGKSAVQSF